MLFKELLHVICQSRLAALETSAKNNRRFYNAEVNLQHDVEIRRAGVVVTTRDVFQEKLLGLTE